MRYLSIVLLFLLFVPLAIRAADTVLEVGIPGVSGAAPGDPLPNIVQYISFLYTFVLGFVGIAGFASLVFWGAVWTGSGIVDKKRQAIDGIKNTLTGIGIALTAFIILNTINPDLTVIRLPVISDIHMSSNVPSYDAIEEMVIKDYIVMIFKKEGGDKEDVNMALRVAKCESSYKSNAIRYNSDKQPVDVGVFQINLPTHKEMSMDNLMDYKKNIDYAYQLFTQNGWDDWFMTYECNSPEGTPYRDRLKKKKDDYCAKNPQICADKANGPLIQMTPATRLFPSPPSLFPWSPTF